MTENAQTPPEGNDLRSVAQTILDRLGGNIRTHSTDCHLYHLECFAAFVLRETAVPDPSCPDCGVDPHTVACRFAWTGPPPTEFKLVTDA